ncbi:MAG TPA: ABC transporter substrate-binding protein [Anaerolineae bacterium]|nr:ABC transporter substrate-binding protein [Anaerolineae bacterium]
MKQQFEQQFNVTVNYVRMSSGEALARLRDEKDNPQFDIWWGGPIDSFIVAKNEGLLAPYDSPNYTNLINQELYKDPDNYWAGIYVGSLAFCTNSDWLAANPNIAPPQSWDDLLKPEFRNQIMVAHPSTSGTSYTAMATIIQIYGESDGWDYINQLSNQITQFTRSGSAPSTFVGQGEDAHVCIGFSHDIIKKIEDEQAPLIMTFPQEGTGYEIGGMAIINNAAHLDLAQKWFDWALTPEIQALGPTYQAYQAPTVAGVALSHPELLEVNLIDYDFIWAAQHKNEIVTKFINEIATADNLKQ